MELHISKDIAALNTSIVEWLVAFIGETLKKQDRFTIALSGGNTPKKIHELLVTDQYKNKIDWSKVHFFWGDERYVPFEDERNNAKMAYETLLNHINVNPRHIHVMRTDIPVEESVADYAKILDEYFGEANPTQFTFDLVLLGMGDDGHTLSLFPGQDVVNEQTKEVTSLWLAAQDMYRITLTAPVVNNSAAVAFIATGDKKAVVLKEVLYGVYQPNLYPSQVIKPTKGQLHWFIDEDAAKLLK